MPNFNTLHLHMLLTGQLSTAYVLSLYPYETAATLAVAQAAYLHN